MKAVFIWPCLSRLLLHLQSPRQRYPINVRAGKASMALGWGPAWGGHPPQMCQFPLPRTRKKPTPLRCCLWDKDAGQLLSGKELPGKIQRNIAGLEKPFPRDKGDSPPGVWLEMGAECPHACSPTPLKCFLPTAGFKHRIFPIWEKKKDNKKRFFHP